MATSNKARRIAKELADIKADTSTHITVETIRDDDLTHLRGMFKGPAGTPYEGGTFYVEIRIPGEYPFRPPQMKFETKVWHPNVSSQTGAICLDTLAAAWSPIMSIKSALISLQSLLDSPEPKDPQDAEVASMLIRSPAEFEHHARDWAVKYANAPRKDGGEGSGGATAESLKKKQQADKDKAQRSVRAHYHGYNKELVDRFVAMGFDVPQVVAAFEYVGIDRMDGQDYELEEAYMGDITARLFGEP